MKQFKIDGITKEFSIKNNWEDLLFNDYIEFQKLEREKELLGMNDDYVVRVLLILTNCSENEILNMDFDLLGELMKEIQFLNGDIPKLESQYVIINDEKWAFKKDLNKLTMGEYISLKTFQENVKDELESTSLMLSVLFRKVSEVRENGEIVLSPYNPEESNKINQLLKKEVKLIDLYHYLSFFFNGTNQSILKDTRLYSVVEELKQNQEATK